METILIFSYSNDINVEVVTGNGNNVLVTKDSSINLIIAKLFGDMVSIIAADNFYFYIFLYFFLKYHLEK